MDSILLVHVGDRVMVREPARPTVVRGQEVRSQVVLAGFPGPRGKQGEKGEKGDTSATGAAYTHLQAAPASTWTINHNLGLYPAIALFTAGGAVFVGQVDHLDLNTARVTLSQPLAGSARCN